MGEHFARPWHLLGDRIHQMALPTVVEDGDSNPSGTQEFTARLETKAMDAYHELRAAAMRD